MTAAIMRLRCGKCDAVVIVERDRVVFDDDPILGIVALDATGWAQGDDHLTCPFHGVNSYWLKVDPADTGAESDLVSAHKVPSNHDAQTLADDPDDLEAATEIVVRYLADSGHEELARAVALATDRNPERREAIAELVGALVETRNEKRAAGAGTSDCPSHQLKGPTDDPLEE